MIPMKKFAYTPSGTIVYEEASKEEIAFADIDKATNLQEIKDALKRYFNA